MPTEHKRGYAEVMHCDPKHCFEETYTHFHTKYGHLDEVEVEQNKEDTEKPWHWSEEFQVLK